jgi:hypothetical protein
MNKLLVLGFLVFFSCTKVDILRDVPECIELKIREFAKSGSICSKGAEVNEHLFQGGKVYVFSQGNCGADFQSGVYGPECNSLGGLGGFTGNTEINGEQFANAKFVAKVWGN